MTGFGYQQSYQNQFQMNKTSAFNDAVNQILRLHRIWSSCAVLRERGDVANWRWKLDSAQVELSNDIDKLDTKISSRRKQERRQEIKQFNKHHDPNRVRPEKPKAISSYSEKLDLLNASIRKLFNCRMGHKEKSIAYDLLMKKEMLLRKIQDESGKGTKYKSEDDEFT